MNRTPSSSAESPGRIHPAPSLLTLCNAFCGFTSLILVLDGHGRENPIPQACVWLLLAAMIFDTLDGLVARWLNAKSRHGAQLDSLADALSFGVAPAVITFVSATQTYDRDPFRTGLALGAALLYLGCAMWRLARFSTQAMEEKKDSDCFVGLPSPAAAALVFSANWILTGLPDGDPLRFYGITSLTMLTGLLMVSRVPYPHARRFVSAETPILSLVLIVSALVTIALYRVPALVAWTYSYFLLAPIAHLWMARNRVDTPIVISTESAAPNPSDR